MTELSHALLGGEVYGKGSSGKEGRHWRHEHILVPNFWRVYTFSLFREKHQTGMVHDVGEYVALLYMYLEGAQLDHRLAVNPYLAPPTLVLHCVKYMHSAW